MAKHTRSYSGMLNYTMTCKECDWIFDTDSTAKLADAGREHRYTHDMRNRIRLQVWRERKEQKTAAQSEVAILEKQIAYLSAAEERLPALLVSLEEAKSRLATAERMCESYGNDQD